jgi:hypothetical protein
MKMKLLKSNNNNNIIIQSGGVTGLIPIIAQTIGTTVLLIFVNLWAAIKHFFTWKRNGYFNPFFWQYGGFWKYIFFCIKSSLYLVIFAFGGPIVTIIGMIYLYINVAKKNLTNQEEEEEKKDDEESQE